MTPAEASAMLPEGESIHTFAGGSMLLGADWDRASVIDLLGKALEIECDRDSLPGKLGHPIAVLRPNGKWIYLEARCES